MKRGKRLLFILGCVLITLLLVGCGGTLNATPTSIPTAIPSQTSTPSPVPTKTPESTLTPDTLSEYVSVTPLVTAPYIEFGGWSPDSQWIAYWVSSQEDVEQPSNYMPGGTLNFMNVTTGETCAVSQFVTPDNRTAEVSWSEEIEAIIVWS